MKCHTGEEKNIAKGFVGLWWVFVKLFKKNEVSNLSKYTVDSYVLSLYNKHHFDTHFKGLTKNLIIQNTII